MVLDEIPASTRPIWIDLGFAKATPTAGEDPWQIFITASSPRIDFQGERIMPEALRDAAKYFLNRGVVSWEHISQANRQNPSLIIGHPTDITFTPDGRTLVKAVLYKNVPNAQHVWGILTSGGRLGASIGGSVLERSAQPGGPPTISRIWLNHLALTAWPVNDDCAVQLTPYAEFMAKALGTASAGPLVMQDVEGARERGTPSFEQRWKALTETLCQQYPNLTEPEARKVAHALLTRRGATREAYVSQSTS